MDQTSCEQAGPQRGSQDTPCAGPAAVRTALSVAAVVERLDVAARRGRLPGFEKGTNGDAFTVAAHGTPFDSVMHARAENVAGGGCLLRFRTQMKPVGPWVFTAILVASVWPGVLLTQSFLNGFEFTAHWWPAWWWYVPLTAPFVPWSIWSALKKSRASAAESARLAAEDIAKEVGGSVEEEDRSKPT